mgnify:CR=1 FL=1
MSLVFELAEYVREGKINQQAAFLAQVINEGINTKEELAFRLGITVRTVERQLKQLYEAGLIHSSHGMLTVATKLSLDQVDISIYNNNIESMDENARKAARILGVSPKRISQAAKNAGVSDTSRVVEAAMITRQRKPKSPVAYFCIVLRNMDSAIQPAQNDKWEEICLKAKPLVSKASYSFFFENATCIERAGKLYLTGTNSREMWHIYGDLLQSCGVAGVLAGGMLQNAI